MSGSTISVVLPTCRPHLAQPTIQALTAQRGVEPEIVVVENGSTTPAALPWLNGLVRSGRVKSVHRESIGLNGARNAGAESANGDIVAFTDDDCVPHPDWCGSLLSAFARHPAAGVVGGSVELAFSGTRPDWVKGPFLGYLSAVDFGGGCRELSRREWLAGANIAFRREALDAAGSFDEAIGMRGDDPATAGNDEMEMLRRVRDRHGWRIVYEPAARVCHRIPDGRLDSAYFLARRFGQGRSDFLLESSLGEVHDLDAAFGRLARRLEGLWTYLGEQASGRGALLDRHERVYVECVVAYALGYYRAAMASFVEAARGHATKWPRKEEGTEFAWLGEAVTDGLDESMRAIESILHQCADGGSRANHLHRWLGRLDGLELNDASQGRSTGGSPADCDQPLPASGPDMPPLRLLVIDEEEPEPTRGFGFPRAAELLAMMPRAGFEVTFFAAREPSLRPGSDVTAQKVCALKALLRADSARFDAVWVSRLRNLRAYLEAAEGLSPPWPVIFDAEAVTSLREILQREARGATLDATSRREIIEREISVARRADMVLAVSRREQAFFADAIEAPVRCVPSPHAVAPGSSSFSQRSDVFFLNGMYWGATRHEAVDYLVGDILPRFADGMSGDVVLYGYGTESIELPEVGSGLANRVRTGGFVEDLPAMYDRHRVCVIPTRHAGGVAWKAIEAMAHGVPIVTTPLIAGQLDDVGDAVLVGRDADEFAAAVVRLYSDRALWRRQREAGLAFVARECDHEAIIDTLRSIRRWIVERQSLRRVVGGSSHEAVPGSAQAGWRE